MYKLIIEDDEGKTTVVPLIRDEITIGRKEGNTIRLTERNVSRRHAKLVKQNGSIFIEDLQSYNGIKVNGDKISGRATVAEGDRIQIGDYQLALKVERQVQVPDQEREDATKPFIREAEGAGPAPAHAATPTVQAPQISATAAPDTERPARVVVVSSNFAGQEFVLAKPLMVIGRTDDNDIVVNHRSISRHHAQIVREGSHYHIVDLQSANGVRVNGEDYGKVELRKGDHVDLGHVRLRFVASGEDFVFARDAEVIDVGGKDKNQGGSKTMIFAAVAAVVLLAGGFFIYKAVSGGPKEPDKGDVKGKVATLNDEVDTAIREQDWDTAIAKSDEGLKLDPSKVNLSEKRTTAQAEKKNKVTFDKYQASVKGKETDKAVALYLSIPDDSVYHAKAQASYATVRKSYVDQRLKAARPMFPARCADLRKLTDEVLTIEPDNTDAQDLARRCNPDAPVTPVVQNTPSHGTVKPDHHTAPDHSLPRTPPQVNVTQPVVQQPQAQVEPVKPPPKEPAGDDAGKGEAIVGEAQDDYVHGNYAGAIEKARKALRLSSGGATSLKAWRVIGTSSCFLHDKKGAVESWNRLDASGRQLLNYVCKRNQIDLQ